MGTGGKDKDGESAQLVGGSKDLESGEEDDSIDKCKPEKKGFGAKCLTCFRGCFGFILFPFVFIITFIACLVWIILLPAKCCSPCCAPLFDWLVQLLMLPVRFYRWVLGKDRDETEIC